MSIFGCNCKDLKQEIKVIKKGLGMTTYTYIEESSFNTKSEFVNFMSMLLPELISNLDRQSTRTLLFKLANTLGYELKPKEEKWEKTKQ